MDEKNRKGREFAQDIDRILAGKEAKINEAIDEDYRSNIDFAQKIIECRGEPSPSFQEGLKRRLLSKLAGQEAAEARQRLEAPSFLDWLRNLLAQRPAWRTAAVTVTVAVLALVVVWRIGLLSPSQEPVVTAPLGPTVSVETRASTAKTAYALGEEIDVQFSFKNLTDEPLTFPFPPGIKIDNTSVETVRAFAAGQDTRTLAPAESVQYDLTWDQKNDAGKQVPPGDYQVIMPNVRLGEGKGVVSLVESPILTISANP
jgi:hypothetical protein